MPAIQVRGLRKSYGAHRGRPRHRPRRGGGRGLRPPRPQRRRQDHHRRDPRGVPGRARRARCRCSATTRPRADRDLKERIGIVLQETGVERYLTVAEVVDLYRGYYRKSRPTDELLALTGLEAQRDQRVKTLSGGQKRRLDLALALAGDPELLFLDEPTTGFDPSARRGAWDVIRGLRDLGKTVLLTTHYMDEAQVLADRVAVIVGGRDRGRGPARQPGRRRVGHRDPLHPAAGPRRRHPARPAPAGEGHWSRAARSWSPSPTPPRPSTPSPAGPWAGASPSPTSPSPVPAWRTSTSS